jgi:hypothetical protein
MAWYVHFHPNAAETYLSSTLSETQLHSGYNYMDCFKRRRKRKKQNNILIDRIHWSITTGMVNAILKTATTKLNYASIGKIILI